MMAQESIRALQSEFTGDVGGTCFTTGLLQAASEKLGRSISPDNQDTDPLNYKQIALRT